MKKARKSIVKSYGLKNAIYKGNDVYITTYGDKSSAVVSDVIYTNDHVEKKIENSSII